MKFEKNKNYKIQSLDHVEDYHEPIDFTVFGRCLKATKGFVTIGCWVYTGESKMDDNEKFFTILRKTIIHAEELI